jgi:hypothetical protein
MVAGKMLERAESIDECQSRLQQYDEQPTRGGLRYSIPILRALLDAFSTSLTRLYLSTRKLSVGPADKRTIRKEGDIGVSVNASKCVTCNAGASVI